MLNRHFVEISNDRGKYRARVHDGDPMRGQVLSSLAIGPEVAPFAELPDTLGSLIERLIAFDSEFITRVLDERLQLELGRYLYDQIFGQLEERNLPTEANVEVEILTQDEHAARLPWVLLARSGRFLSATGWAITMGQAGIEHEDSLLPPSPKMLVVIPQPAGLRDTHAEAHLEDLELMLVSADHLFGQGRHLRVATTWSDFCRLAGDFRPHLLYYYGHGSGDRRTSRLIFAKNAAGQPLDVPVADVAHVLCQAPVPPLIAYVNCCLGDAGGLLGVGWQLGEVVPAVLTNRAVAFIETARQQAMQFWRAVLLNGASPHGAIAEMYRHLGDMGLGFRDARWMTPVLYRHYDQWESHPPRSRNRIDDPHWHVKLDRVRQFSQVVFQTQKMLQRRKPPTLAYLWYGQEGQGIEQFHQRLKVELRDFLGNAHLLEVRPRWPDDVHYRSFDEMMAEAFEVLTLDDVPARIRSSTRGGIDHESVVYVRHEPIRAGEVMGPAHLPDYLEWWDDVFAPRLREASAFGLLGISFVVQNPSRFLQALTRHGFDDLELRHLVHYLLDEMERLAKDDLLEFLRAHEVMLPRNRRSRILEEILEKTEGHYEMTLDALRDLVHRAWDENPSRREPTPVTEDENDW